MSVERCPSCSGRRLGEGYFSGYASLTPKGKIAGSKVTARVCADCGLIVELRVNQPQRFLPKEG